MGYVVRLKYEMKADSIIFVAMPDLSLYWQYTYFIVKMTAFKNMSFYMFSLATNNSS